MEDISLDPVKDRPLYVEIKKLLLFGEKNNIDVTRGLRELKKAIGVAEQVPDSKVVDEYLKKCRRELDKTMTDYLMRRYAAMDKEAETKSVKSRDLEVCLKTTYSAIGIKHYELALTNIQKCEDELKSLSRPPFEKILAADIVKCDMCMGKIKAGLSMIKCSCGKIYHEPCANRKGKCDCGVQFG